MEAKTGEGQLIIDNDGSLRAKFHQIRWRPQEVQATAGHRRQLQTTMVMDKLVDCANAAPRNEKA